MCSFAVSYRGRLQDLKPVIEDVMSKHEVIRHIKGNRGKEFIPLEVKYKGCRHKLSKLVQEEQGLVDCYV